MIPLQELFPIGGGLLLGTLLALARRPLARWLIVLAVVLIGVLATVVSGEILIGPEFLLFDIPLVAICAAVAFLAVRVLRGRAARGPRERE